MPLVEIYDKENELVDPVMLVMVPTDKGVELVAVDEFGDTISTLLEVTEDGLRLFTGVAASISIPKDKHGRLKVIRK